MELDVAAGDLDRLRADVERLGELSRTLSSSLRHQMLGLRADAQAVSGPFDQQVRRHVDSFERQFGIPVTLECGAGCDTSDVPLGVAAQLVRVLQEALANVHLHAQATRVHVRLLPSRTRIRLEIEDDGNGFDPTSVPDSRLGVRIMSERMQQVDGRRPVRPGDRRWHAGDRRGAAAGDHADHPRGGGPVSATGALPPQADEPGPPTTVLVVDDHALFRDGLIALISRWPDFEVIGTAADGAEAVRLAAALHPRPGAHGRADGRHGRGGGHPPDHRGRSRGHASRCSPCPTSARTSTRRCATARTAT